MIWGGTPLPTGTAQGGNMTHNYSYDGLYRLTSATGTFEGSGSGTAQKTAGYSLNMAYDNLYNIISKKEDISQSNVQFSGTLNAGYSLTYNYANNPFQISDLGDANYRKDGTIATQDTLQQNHKYTYDANGNLIYVNTSTDTKSGVTNKTNERKLLWDEENRLMGVDDNGFVSLYWYDASGERTVKESGYNEGIYVNSTFSGGITDNGNNFTAYVNPYMVVTAGGNYTKHIYIGSQRIVSKLGDLSSYGADPRRIAYAGSECNVTKDYASMYNNSLTQIKNRYNIFGVPYNGIDNNDYVNGQGFCCSDSVVKAPALRAMQPNDNSEKLQFYYHSDHLGSTSLITDLDGNVAQHVEYIPFGEVFIEERNATWNTPYKFNAKELDEETGLYYYGARYYDPRVSVWLGVDPMWEKYQGISVFTFCLDRPVKFEDFDGRVINLANNYEGAMENIAKIAATNGGQEIINRLILHSKTYTLDETFWTAISSSFDPDTRTITYGTPWFIPEKGRFTTMTVMGHEIFHAFEHSFSEFSRSDLINNPDFYKQTQQRAIDFENYLRNVYSISPLRANSKGSTIEKITNFQTLGNNTDKTSFGFSYTKTTPTLEVKTPGSLPVVTGSTTATYYMIVTMDKNKNVTYKNYNNYDDYKKTTKNW